MAGKNEVPVKSPRPKRPRLSGTVAKTKKKKPDFIFAIGRRKTASANVHLHLKSGPIMVNGKPIEQYFPLETNKQCYLLPFRTVDSLGKYSATIEVEGSGKAGQLGAVVHGIARALAKLDKKEFRPLLKREGLLTRDARMKERRKAGYAHKARARKQSPKR